MRNLIVICMIVAACSPALAQELRLLNADDKPNIFNHLDASITLGTTGIGFDVATPVGDYVQLRAGYAFMPHFNYHMHFDVQVGDTKESKYDANGNRVETKFDKLAGMLEGITGYEVDDQVEMIGQPTYNNLKVLVDVFPFKQDKRWHVTAGFFLGPSRIAKAYNVTEAMPSLLAVGIYNTLYDRANIAYNDLANWPQNTPFIEVGNFSVDDDQTVERIYNYFHRYGRMGMHVGDRLDGTPYMMEPGTDGMVKADMKVNAFKPYLGLGYGGRLLKNNDRFHVAVDCGAMFWGGTPSIVTHDGTNLTKDVRDIDGKVGDYVKLAKAFKVFPVLDVRFVYNLF